MANHIAVHPASSLWPLNTTLYSRYARRPCGAGGSYSNLWCSLFNADLALSVAMTTVSTIMSLVMLPLNLLIYINLTYLGTAQNFDVFSG